MHYFDILFPKFKSLGHAFNEKYSVLFSYHFKQYLLNMSKDYLFIYIHYDY